MKQLWRPVLLCILVTLAGAFQDVSKMAPEMTTGITGNLTTTQMVLPEKTTGHDHVVSTPSVKLLKCVCSMCPNNECETDGQCYVAINRETSGERHMYREQACLNKSKQFPPDYSHKCRGGHSLRQYDWITEEIYCCRDDDYCNQHELPAGGATPPHSQQELPPGQGPGQMGGEGKASASPATTPTTRLESCH